MFRSLLGFVLVLVFAVPAFAKPSAETSLLNLCDSFGETRQECQCYMDEVRQIYTTGDIELAGGISRAFMSGQEPEAIVAYILMTRKVTVTRASEIYKLGDKHVDRVGKKCEDQNQKITPAMKAKRDAMGMRLEKIGARYRIGSKP